MTDAEEDEIGAPGELGGVLRLDGATADQVVHRLAVAVAEDGERIALLDDVLGHAMAHQPDADEADTFLRGHGSLLRAAQ
jgi:hypothetical protein